MNDRSPSMTYGVFQACLNRLLRVIAQGSGASLSIKVVAGRAFNAAEAATTFAPHTCAFNNMTQAQHAVRAAKHYRQWGRYMSVAYLNKRNVPRRLLTIALQLEAVRGVDI